MARVRILATMTTRTVAMQRDVPTGCAAKPRINVARSRDGARVGYRVFHGRSYKGYFRLRKQAEKFVRDQGLPIVQMPAHAQPLAKHYRHVAHKKLKNRTVYYGVLWVQGSKDKKWTKKYFTRCDSAKAAAALVAEYLKTTPSSIKIIKTERESPEQSAERMAYLSNLFCGWCPADLTDAVAYRGKASSLQVSGPAVYVAGLVGKEDRWRSGLLQVWDAMPLSERAKLHWVGSRDEGMAQAGARALHDVLSLSFAWWGGWSIPRLRSMSWPVDVRNEIAPPTSAQQAALGEERQWWKLHVH